MRKPEGFSTTVTVLSSDLLQTKRRLLVEGTYFYGDKGIDYAEIDGVFLVRELLHTKLVEEITDLVRENDQLWARIEDKVIEKAL